MNWFSLFIGNWRIIGVAILLSIIGLQHIHNQNADKEIDALKTQYRLENAVREAQAREVKNRSESTLRSVKDEHSKLVAAAEKNAWANFQRKYANAGGSPLGSGIRGDPAIGVRDNSTGPNGSPADSPKASDDRPNQGIMAFDGGLLERFAIDCAKDAAALVEWRAWAGPQGNNLPIEK